MIGLTNFLTTSFDKRFFKKIAEFVLEKENKKGTDLSIVLVDKKKMRELNKKYRHEDKVTNVLSFCYEQGKPFVFPLKNLVKLGEIVICPEYIKEDAQKRSIDFREELVRISIHGILHILGYNHKTERSLKRMNDLQERYLYLYFNQQ